MGIYIPDVHAELENLIAEKTGTAPPPNPTPKNATIEQVLAVKQNRDSLEKAPEIIPSLPTYYLIENGRNTHSYNWRAEPAKPIDPANTPVLVKIDREFPKALKKATVVDFATFDLARSSDYSYAFDTRTVTFVMVLDVGGIPVTAVVPFNMAEKHLGLIIIEGTKGPKFQIGTLKRDFKDWATSLSYVYGEKLPFRFTLEELNNFHYRFGEISHKNVQALLLAALKGGYSVPMVKGSGIAKTEVKIRPFLEEIKLEDPVSFCYVRSLIEMSKRTIDGVKVSTILNEVFDSIKTKGDFVKTLSYKAANKEADDYYWRRYDADAALKRFPTWTEKRKAVLKSQGNRAFSKLIQEFDSLKLDEKKFPKTAKAIKDGELAIGTFFRRQEQYFVFNDNWDLWEKMLTFHHDQAIALANEVKGRTTYEKDLMSYFYFILYSLPKYLQKNTGKKWTCLPKLVNSSDELEPPKADDSGTRRKRSALTPIVDNEKCTVEVPYASLAIPGRQTGYCYSHDYHVLTTGFSFNGNVVMRDTEQKLNGRDDYGLMFYTLTGSTHCQGYPTFLIIFERKSKETVVHFHRTHPSRSKDGDYNPIHNWIKVCYNWMCGNINKDLIAAQQGDLVFVKTDKDVEFKSEVASYDKHCFAEPVQYADATEKGVNILCYVNVAKDTTLQHTEHENVTIPAGKYAIYQCRSWEASPRGIWVLRID